MRMTSRIIVTTLCFLFAGAARAELSDVTGESYSWVAYNNMTATLGQTLPANTTGFTVDNDRTSLEVPSGELVAYASGAGTGVTLTVSEVNPVPQYLWVDTTAAQNPGLIFSDALGASYTGNVIAHNLGSTQLLTFAGLDPSVTYTFAGVATAPSRYHNSLSTVVIQGADAAVNESVITANPTLSWRGNSMTASSAGDTMYISFLDDDLAMWSGIDPGADASFSVLVTSVLIGDREWAPGLDAIVLAAEGSAGAPLPGDFDTDGDVDDDDVDLLRDNLGDGQYDLDGDGDADGDDLVYLVENLLEWYNDNPGAGEGTALGDLNRDGHVNGDDLTLMKFGYGGRWANGNLNTDSLVDGTDLAILKVNMGFDAAGSSGTTEPPPDVPEPASAALLVLGGSAALVRRRRRTE
ncbi:hypothetical protein LCGC14_0124550 [marine sediment metagenome]|uniref:Ice-binding protein C-terminal domain-containing protein n=1 Tax=marine sediment metagenome TaxID=412755 RepID=A0A0F9V600_9ZZZZ|nr:PEP-CTERM sorting domain-containing protein [Phycisphaerae bacterium]HDZ42355.1 PEP-CTERM sorting domain-containing protein [Phycisphaerae bacterium]